MDIKRKPQVNFLLMPPIRIIVLDNPVQPT